MRAIVTRAKKLSGDLKVPGDKSISHRAVLFGALAKGTTVVHGLAPGGDVRSSQACVSRLGVQIRPGANGTTEIVSPGREGWTRGQVALDAGNSGTTARLLMGMLAPVDGIIAFITGDESLTRRPMKRVAGPLASMGARIELSPTGALPATVRGGRLQGAKHRLTISSAQVKTSLLLAGLAAEGETWVHEPELSRDHTERLIPAFGATLLRSDADGVGVRAQSLTATTLTVPGDPSSAAFFAAAAAVVPGSNVRIAGVGTNPTRAGIIEVLSAMGAPVRIEDEQKQAEPYGTWVCSSGALRGTSIAGEIVPRLIDEVPVLAVTAALAQGTTTIRDAAELRVKESDRLKLVAQGLKSMGADVEELPDGLVIHGGKPLHGARIDSGMDHRIAMSFAVAGLVADGETIIDGVEWADISFPGFFKVLSELSGGCVRLE